MISLRLLLVIYLSFFATAANAQWSWIQKQERHRAVVAVSSGDGGGTGTMIGHDCQGAIVITAAHIFGGKTSGTIRSMTNGSRFAATVIYADDDSDLCILHAPLAIPAVTVPLGDFMPARGEDVEIIGCGGPRSDTLRTFTGRFLGERRSDPPSGIDIDCPVISGDSGGAMLCRGSLVGIVRGGERIIPGGEWPLNYPAQSDISGKTLCSTVTQILQRFRCTPQVCGPQGYPPGFSQPSNQSGSLYPPQQYQQLTPSAQASSPVANQPNCQPGVACQPGPIGPQGPPGKDGSVTEQQIQSIIAEVVSTLKNDPTMRGPTGPRGPAGEMGLTGPTGIAGTSKEVNVDALTKAVLAKLPSTRVVLVDGTKKIIDDETYKPGEPIVLDINTLTRSRTQ